jgi:hypothetical protein
VPTETPARPKRITAVCAEGDHTACLGTVYVWPLPASGDYLVLCECSVCNHRLATYT